MCLGDRGRTDFRRGPRSSPRTRFTQRAVGVRVVRGGQDRPAPAARTDRRTYRRLPGAGHGQGLSHPGAGGHDLRNRRGQSASGAVGGLAQSGAPDRRDRRPAQDRHIHRSQSDHRPARALRSLRPGAGQYRRSPRRRGGRRGLVAVRTGATAGAGRRHPQRSARPGAPQRRLLRAAGARRVADPLGSRTAGRAAADCRRGAAAGRGSADGDRRR